MRTKAILAACLLGLSPLGHATLVTDSADFASTFVIDFSEFAPGQMFTRGPVQIGSPVGHDIEWSALPAGGLGDNSSCFGDNGCWSFERGGHSSSAIVGPINTMTYVFNDGLVAGVGGFMNYCESAGNDGCFEPNVLIQVLAIDGSILESYNLIELAPISTPGGSNDGAFRGILRPQNDIAAFKVTGGRFVALDDLSVIQVVPIPAAFWLLASAVMGLCIKARRY